MGKDSDDKSDDGGLGVDLSQFGIIESKKRLGFVFNVKCYHPKEDKEYQCITVEGDDENFQEYRCPKCNHEISLYCNQYFFSKRQLGH